MPRRTYRYAEGMGWDDAEPDRDDRRASSSRSRSLVFLVNVIYTAEARRRSPPPTRGTAARSSGRSRRRRPSTTSPRSRRSRRATTAGTASTPRTRKAGSCGCRRGGAVDEADDHDDATATARAGTASTCRRRRIYPLVVAARAPDHRLRRGVPQLVARDRRARAARSSASTPGALEPATEPETEQVMATIEQVDRRSTRRPRRLPAATAHGRARHRTPASPTPSSAMWLFLSSDCLFFGAFISTYLLYRDRAGQAGPTPERRLRHPVHVGDVVHPADEQPHDGARARGDPAGRLPPVPDLDHRHRAVRRHVHRRPDLRVHRVHPRGPQPRHQPLRVELLRAHRPPRRARRPSASSGCSRSGASSMQGSSSRATPRRVEIAGLYWHFVDVVWIVIFTVIYLIPK